MTNDYGRLSIILQRMIATLHRFPIVAIALLSLYSITFLDYPNFRGDIYKIWIGTTLVLLPFSLISYLSLEFFGIKKAKQLNLFLIPIAAALYLYLNFVPTKIFTHDLILFFFSTLMLAYTAPVAHINDNEKVSYYWQSLASSIRWALIAAFIFCAGLCAITASVNALFDNIIPKRAYAEIFRFSLIILFPFSFLSATPTRDSVYAVTVCNAPQSLKIIATWLMIPLSLLFLVVVYAYAAKVSIMGTSPKLVLVGITMACSLVTIFTYMVTYPLTSENIKQATFIHRNTFALLAVPCLILVWRFGIRIAEYGMTLPRFYAVLFILWLAVNIAYGIYSQRKSGQDIKVPLLTGGVLLAVLSLSPVSPAHLLNGNARTFMRDIASTRAIRDNTQFKVAAFSFKQNTYKVRAFSISGYDLLIPNINIGSYKNLREAIDLTQLSDSKVIASKDGNVTFGYDKERILVTICPANNSQNCSSIPFEYAAKGKELMGAYDFAHKVARNMGKPLILSGKNAEYSVMLDIIQLRFIYNVTNKEYGLNGVNADIYIKKNKATKK